ncbi:hypothetical protein PMIN05_003650 [Paraphaeosphaeria minitans]
MVVSCSNANLLVLSKIVCQLLGVEDPRMSFSSQLFLAHLALSSLESRYLKMSSNGGCSWSLPASRLHLTQPPPHPRTRQTTSAEYAKINLLGRNLTPQLLSSSTIASTRSTSSARSNGWTGCSETGAQCTRLHVPTAAA